MLIIASKPGQLGNMLFTSANVIAAAHEYGLSVANPAFNEYATYFPATRDDFLCRYPLRKSAMADSNFARKAFLDISSMTARGMGKTGVKLPFVRTVTLWDWDTDFDLTDPDFLRATRGPKLTFLRGWKFRASALLEKHGDLVRSYFRPLDHHMDNVASLIQRARIDVDVLVGVHIRHGIIFFANTKKYFYTPEQYAGFMRQILHWFPGKRVGFLICSDRKQQAAPFQGLNVHFGNYDLIEDMYSFASCDYIVGAPSTYTMWASFYGKVPLNLIADPNKPLQLADFVIRY